MLEPIGQGLHYYVLPKDDPVAASSVPAQRRTGAVARNLRKPTRPMNTGERCFAAENCAGCA
jgi:hypothetical protein